MNQGIKEIMREHGVTCTAEEFQEAVNLTFHRHEAAVYDQIHSNMKETLPRQFGLLTSDIRRSLPEPGIDLRVLDVGCGTGLSSELLLGTPLGGSIGSVDLLDTSSEMLEKARDRASRWEVESRVIEGTTEELAGGEPYDLILVCSVLHHIPDLAGFATAVSGLQRKNAIFMHIQDPNGDYLQDQELQKRMRKLDVVTRSHVPKWVKRLGPRRLLSRLYRELGGNQGESYLSRANQDLMESGVIRSPMSPPEIWSITDIHEHDGLGVSISGFRRLLPEYELVGARSYSFFGRLWSDLPKGFRKEEEALVESRAMNGYHLAGAWRKIR